VKTRTIPKAPIMSVGMTAKRLNVRAERSAPANPAGQRPALTPAKAIAQSNGRGSSPRFTARLSRTANHPLLPGQLTAHTSPAAAKPILLGSERAHSDGSIEVSSSDTTSSKAAIPFAASRAVLHDLVECRMRAFGHSSQVGDRTTRAHCKPMAYRAVIVVVQFTRGYLVVRSH